MRELLRALDAFPEDVAEEITDELHEAAQPVAVTARARALTNITNMPRSPEWAAMRIGVAKRAATVWVAPQLRGNRTPGRGRPNLATKLMDEAMQPALEENTDKVVKRLDDMVDRIADHHGF